jgi:hypothetical protein
MVNFMFEVTLVQSFPFFFFARLQCFRDLQLYADKITSRSSLFSSFGKRRSTIPAIVKLTSE